MSELVNTSIHEAGHAVMAYLLHRPFMAISVVEDELTLGRVSHRPPGDWFRPDIEVTSRTRRLIEDHVIILAAGPETEAAALELEQRWAPGSEQDVHTAVGLLMPLCGSNDEVSAYFEWLRQRAVTVVGQSRFQALVGALAPAVFDAGTLSWREAKAVMTTADPMFASMTDQVNDFLARTRSA